MLKHKSSSGFLLLQAVFAICALSIISAIGISKMKALRSQKKHETIQQNYEIIRCSISSFLFRNNRLPKPSISIIDGNENSYISSGYLPYKSLGLPRTYATDNEGNAIYYTPHPELTRDFSYISDDLDKDVKLDENASFCHAITENQIRLIDSQNEIINGNFVIAFVLSDKPVVNNEGINEIKITGYTYWITRDLLLTKYLKLPPCKCTNTAHHINLMEDDLF